MAKCGVGVGGPRGFEEPLKQSVVSRGIGASVRFLGVVDDVAEVLRASDLFVFPSVREGLPLAVVEAQASGLPTVMSTGVPESALMGTRIQSDSFGKRGLRNGACVRALFE